jgi:hypothetical protein
MVPVPLLKLDVKVTLPPEQMFVEAAGADRLGSATMVRVPPTLKASWHPETADVALKRY